MPWIGCRVAKDAIGSRKGWRQRQFAGIGVALRPLRSFAVDPEHVLEPWARAGEETGPCPVPERGQPVARVWRPAGRRRQAERSAGQETNIPRARRPGAKGRAAGDEIRAHGRRAVDELELDAHPDAPPPGALRGRHTRLSAGSRKGSRSNGRPRLSATRRPPSSRPPCRPRCAGPRQAPCPGPPAQPWPTVRRRRNRRRSSCRSAPVRE